MRRSIAVLLVVLLLSACAAPVGSPIASAGATASDHGPVTVSEPRATAAPADATAAAAAINSFGLDLYRRVAAGAENVVVSPASIAIALAMARAGARGITAAEMDAVLYDVASDTNASGLHALDGALAGRSGTFEDGGGRRVEVTLGIANAPFAQRGMALRPAYLEGLEARFGAGLRLVDYAGAPEEARRTINGWVDERTKQRIPELLRAGDVDTLTRLALVNAIYLEAPWLRPFPAETTRPALFTRRDGSQVEVPMMSTQDSLHYAEGDGWRAAEIPYVGQSMALTVIVPDDLAAFEAGLTGDGLAELVAALDTRRVTLGLPRFGIETRAELGPVLAALGMPSAFGPGADFGGITAERSLAISRVVHQANIEIDEKGTEAAAATAVLFGESAGAGAPVTLLVDRPFLFALRDVPTGTVLFLGRVADPSVRSE